MRLTIHSHFTGASWAGEIPDPASEDAPLEYVFRQFNRVVQEDADRLESWGYNLPSLSVGDHVELDGTMYVCAPLGWREITETEDQP